MSKAKVNRKKHEAHETEQQNNEHESQHSPEHKTHEEIMGLDKKSQNPKNKTSDNFMSDRASIMSHQQDGRGTSTKNVK